MIDNKHDYLTEIDLPFDKEKLLKEYKDHENDMIPVYNSSTHALDWYKNQDTWLFNKKPTYNENTEVKKLQSLVETILGGKKLSGSPRFVLQKANSNLPMHVDWETTASLNIIISDHAGPIEFEEYGEILYKCALLNVKSPHRVPPYPKDRLFLKIRMPTDMTYFECREKFNDFRRTS